MHTERRQPSDRNPQLDDNPRLERLRRVADADGPDLEHLIRTCWDAYPGCVLDVDAEEPWLRAPATALEPHGARLWVLDEHPTDPVGHRLAASVALWPTDRPGVTQLKSLYVWPGARKRGLGEALVGHAEATARSAGASRMELWSDTRFDAAHRLYERLGYQRGGTRELHDLSASVEYFFSREL